MASRETPNGGPFGSSETLFSDSVPLVNAEEWLLRTDYAASKSGPQQPAAAARLAKVKEMLAGLLPDVEGIRVSAPAKTSEGACAEAKTPYGWVPMRGLGLGYRTMIAWMVDLAIRLFERYADSPDPLKEPAIVLVDEIDLHLHPSWQRTLMGYLSGRLPNTQFIVTAHSPLVVQAAADANIAVLRREGDHVVIDQDVKTVRGWRIDQVLASDLFGGIPARPPDVDAALAERKRLIAKGERTAAEKERLRELDRLAGELPTAEKPEDIEAMEIIRRAAKHLESGGGSGV